MYKLEYYGGKFGASSLVEGGGEGRNWTTMVVGVAVRAEGLVAKI